MLHLDCEAARERARARLILDRVEAALAGDAPPAIGPLARRDCYSVVVDALVKLVAPHSKRLVPSLLERSGPLGVLRVARALGALPWHAEQIPKGVIVDAVWLAEAGTPAAALALACLGAGPPWAQMCRRQRAAAVLGEIVRRMMRAAA